MKDNVPILTQSQLREAPWNQEDNEPIEVDCCVAYCISKTMPVKVRNYETSEDVSGSLCKEETEYFLDDTNFIEEYRNDGDAMGIPTLLNELHKLCREKLAKLKDELNLTTHNSDWKQIRRDIYHYASILKASKGWVVDDLDVCKDE